jgi:hypothetical protein
MWLAYAAGGREKKAIYLQADHLYDNYLLRLLITIFLIIRKNGWDFKPAL